MKYFSVKISHALTVTNNSKELTVYLEKSSSPLNKQQQQQETTPQIVSLKTNDQNNQKQKCFSTSLLQIFIRGWAFQ